MGAHKRKATMPSILEGVQAEEKRGEKSEYGKINLTVPRPIHHALRLMAAQMSVETGQVHTISSLARIAVLRMFERGEWHLDEDLLARLSHAKDERGGGTDG